jgi:hypothetical protein
MDMRASADRHSLKLLCHRPIENPTAAESKKPHPSHRSSTDPNSMVRALTSKYGTAREGWQRSRRQSSPLAMLASSPAAADDPFMSDVGRGPRVARRAAVAP